MKTLILFAVWLIISMLASPNVVYGSFVIVKKGDYLYKIAKEHHVSWYKLRKINRNNLRFPGDDSLIYPGQKIFLPEGDKKVVSNRNQQAQNFFTHRSGSQPQNLGRKNVSQPIINHKSNIIYEFFYVGLFLLALERIRKLLISLWNYIAEKKKKVFIAFSVNQNAFAYVACDSRFVYCAQKKKLRGLKELACLLVKEDSFKALKSLAFAVPSKFRQEYIPLCERQKERFQHYVWMAQSEHENKKEEKK